MKRRIRLRGRRDFQALVSGRRVFAGAGLVAFARPGATDHTRIGVAVSRQVKGSVNRNRVRRRLREACRVGFLPGLADWAAARPGITFDVVLIARPAALRVPFDSLRAEVVEFAHRLQATGLARAPR